jgi:hypothetical protein
VSRASDLRERAQITVWQNLQPVVLRAASSGANNPKLPRPSSWGGSAATVPFVGVASIVVVAAQPGVTDWLTAIGTVAVAIAAVGVAFFAEWRAGVRVRDEREHAAKVLTDERAAADERLKTQLAHSDAQLQAERQISQDAEQMAEAYAVQVVMAEMAAGELTGDGYDPVDESVRKLAIMIVNRGRYTITRVEAQFCTDGANLITHKQFRRLAGYDALPDRLRGGFHRLDDDTGCGDQLAPGDTGMRFETGPVGVEHIAGPYPVARWIDRWGQRWQQKKGVVQKINEGAPWRA